MRVFVMALLAWGLAGCVTQPDNFAENDPQKAASRAKIHTELAAAYYESAQYKTALEELDKALRADARYAPAYSVRGLVHMTLQEDAEADQDFQHSLNLDASDSDVQNNYGWFLCQHGRMPDAMTHFMAAAKDPLYRAPEKAYLNAGVCSRKAGIMQDAEKYLQRALLMQPNMPEALVNLAEIAFIGGDYMSAKTYYTRFEKQSISPTAENLLLAVRIEGKLGNRSAAANYAARLKNNFPDSREAQILKQIR